MQLISRNYLGETKWLTPQGESVLRSNQPFADYRLVRSNKPTLRFKKKVDLDYFLATGEQVSF